MTTVRNVLVAATLSLSLGGTAAAEEKEPPKVEWTAGPAEVDVGKSLAKLELPDSLAWAGADDAQKLLRWMGNAPGGDEVGLVVPKEEGQGWFVVLEYDAVGYVKDDEKDSIDADAILSSVREGTEAGNERRKKEGISPLHVTGWAEKPHYDDRTHNLTWAIAARDEDGHEVVNHQVRLLGRNGVMALTLVDSPDRLAVSKPEIDRLVAAFSYKQGKTYAEWVPGDKVAEYGLTALVAAGAGAAAVKLGFFAFLAKLFAKFGKVLVAGVVAVGVALKRFWSAFRGKAPERPPTPGGGPPAAPPYAT